MQGSFAEFNLLDLLVINQRNSGSKFFMNEHFFELTFVLHLYSSVAEETLYKPNF